MQNQKGSLLDSQAQVVQRAKEVADRRQEQLGDAHPETLSAFLDLANALFDSGDFRRARGLLETLVHTMDKELDPRSYDVIRANDLLAIVLTTLGHVEQAASLQEVGYRTVVQEFGVDSELTRVAAVNLANSYRSLGRFIEEETLRELVVDRDRRVLGVDSIEWLRSTATLATTKHNLGQFGVSLELNERALLGLREHFSEPRYEIGVSINIAQDLVHLREFGDAAAIFNGAIDIAKKYLDKDDPLRRSIEKDRRKYERLAKYQRD
jgi:tetratricopeptide (TPR) repeat protein